MILEKASLRSWVWERGFWFMHETRTQKRRPAQGLFSGNIVRPVPPPMDAGPGWSRATAGLEARCSTPREMPAMAASVIRRAGPEDLETLWEFLAMAAYEPDAAAAKA